MSPFSLPHRLRNLYSEIRPFLIHICDTSWHCMFFPSLTSGWEDLPPIDNVPTWDHPSTPACRHVASPLCTPVKPCCRCSFHPYHHANCSPAHTFLEPPSSAFESPSHHFSTTIQRALSQALINGWADSTLTGYSCHIHHFLGFCK